MRTKRFSRKSIVFLFAMAVFLFSVQNLSFGQVTLTASSAAPLTEATLGESEVTLTLQGATFKNDINKIRGGVSASGIPSVILPASGFTRNSDTQITIRLFFHSNLDRNGTLTFQVNNWALQTPIDSDLTAEIPVIAVEESLTATPSSLTEATLHGGSVTLTLYGRKFADNIEQYVTHLGIHHFRFGDITRLSDTQVTVPLEFYGDLNSDATLTFWINSGGIPHYAGPNFRVEVPVSAETAPVTAPQVTTPVTAPQPVTPPQNVPTQPPDLVISAIRASKVTLTPGEQFTLFATVENRGTGQSPAAPLQFQRATTDFYTQIGTRNINPLSANGSVEVNFPLTAPVQEGIYHYRTYIQLTNNHSDWISITVAAPATPPPVAVVETQPPVVVAGTPVNTQQPTVAPTSPPPANVRATFQPTVAPTPQPTVVTIPDANLRTAIQQEIGNTITTNTMGTLTFLDAYDLGISDLTGLEHATNLTELYLWENSISDVSPLAGLTRLTELDLYDNNISDISSLVGLTRLTDLSLEENPLNDAALTTHIPAIQANGTQVEFDDRVPTTQQSTVVTIPDPNLRAAIQEEIGNTITTNTMRTLTSLYPEDFGISDLTGLEHATNLSVLYLDFNNISDVSPLAGLTQLTHLGLGGNNISDVSALAGMTQLTQLSLDGNNISDVSALAGMTQLARLWLDGNNISDVSPLAGLTQLTHLLLEDNPLSAVSITTHIPAIQANGTQVKFDDRAVTTQILVDVGDRPSMYWIDTAAGTLHRLVDAEVENLVPSVQNATSLTLDVANDTLYWTEKTSKTRGKIRSANLDGTNVQLVKDLTSVPLDITLDAANGKLYLTNSWGKIQRMNLDGSGFQANFITDLDTLTGLAIDAAGGKLYWTEKTGESTGSIRSANLNGTNVQLLRNLTSVPLDIALDAADGKLYLTSSSGKVQRMNFDRSGFQSNFITGLNTQMNIAVDTAGQRLYLTSHDGTISCRDLSGGDSEEVVTGLGNPGALVLGDASLGDQMAGTTPQTAPPATTDRAEDVNQDGKVDHADVDMVSAALFGGNPPANPGRLDVNGDGELTIDDLTQVSNNLDEEEAAEAPALRIQLNALARDKIQAAIDMLLATNDGSLGVRRTLAYLQNLLAMARPDETQLFTNYPNPFNPETWLPYQLSTDSDVRITIYDVKGKVIRRLVLGHQAAGYYTARSRAAYWDGRNAVGEPVASGLYFYTFTAGDFTATRRMLILK